MEENNVIESFSAKKESDWNNYAHNHDIEETVCNGKKKSNSVKSSYSSSSFFERKRSFFYHNRAWLSVFGGLLIHFTLGSMHCFGNLSQYIASYLREEDRNMSGIRYRDITWIYTASVVCQGLFGFFGGKLDQKFGPRAATLIGSVIMSSGFFLSYYTMHNYFLFFLTFGVITGIGYGICYPVPLSCAMNWMPKRKGFVSGIIFVGRGISVFIITPLQSWFVNPNDIYPDFAPFADSPMEKYFTDHALLEKVPLLFWKMGLILFLIQVLGCLLLFDVSTDDLQYLNRKKDMSEVEDAEFARDDIDYSSNEEILCSKEVVNSLQFWLLWFMMFFTWQAVAFSFAFWKLLGSQEILLRDFQLSKIGSLAAFANTFGRGIWGYLGDIYGFRFCMVFLCSTMTIFMVLLAFAGPHSLILFTFCTCGIFLAHGGAFAIFPGATADTFGKTNFGPVFGLLFSARALSSITSTILFQLFSSYFGLKGMCFLISSFTFTALLLSLRFDQGKRVLPKTKL